VSYTELYKITKTGNVKPYKEYQNSWRGAMMIWRKLEEKYLPPFLPDWFMPTPNHTSAHRNTVEEMQEVWDLVEDSRLTIQERICMATTFDGYWIKRDIFGAVAEAYDWFAGNYTGTSLGEMAQDIHRAIMDTKCYGLCWNHTSVNGDWYVEYGPNGGIKPYNIFRTNRRLHYELSIQKPELFNLP
jgi:hypothetical protein